ncbi:MAG: hypothetical protein AAFO74_00180 [Pseudomonadota bacterium]
MFREVSQNLLPAGAVSAAILSSKPGVNAVSRADDFVTAEPTPKPESRRGWRRRRVRRGKS